MSDQFDTDPVLLIANRLRRIRLSNGVGHECADTTETERIPNGSNASAMEAELFRRCPATDQGRALQLALAAVRCRFEVETCDGDATSIAEVIEAATALADAVRHATPWMLHWPELAGQRAAFEPYLLPEELNEIPDADEEPPEKL